MTMTSSSILPLTSRFSQHARRALAQARLLAQDFQHEVVDTDHLVVGVLREKSSLGFRVLNDLDADERRAELEVRVLHPRIDPLVASPAITEALRHTLALAEEESTWFGHHYVGTEHLLLALARSREGAAPRLLHTLMISPDQIRRRVRLLLSDGVTELSIEAAKRVARLSELSRRVLNAAQQLAAQHVVQAAGLPHLLLVLSRERRSTASRWLAEAGLDCDALEMTVRQLTGPDAAVQAVLLEDVIDSAVNHADRLGTHYTGTDHMLLAIITHEVGAQLLRAFGVEPQALVQAVMRSLAPATPPD